MNWSVGMVFIPGHTGKHLIQRLQRHAFAVGILRSALAVSEALARTPDEYGHQHSDTMATVVITSSKVAGAAVERASWGGCVCSGKSAENKPRCHTSSASPRAG